MIGNRASFPSATRAGDREAGRAGYAVAAPGFIAFAVWRVCLVNGRPTRVSVALKMAVVAVVLSAAGSADRRRNGEA